uniref:Uncharacterized protein n=2 Tax=Rhodnius TaxID=13248 RepID=T1HLI4_RHOPR
MKKYTVLMLSLLIVYSECWLINDALKDVKQKVDNILSGIRPETDDSPRATTIETLLESSNKPAVVTEETTATTDDNMNQFSSTAKVELTTQETRRAIDAKELCESGFQKDPSGKCRGVFGL